MAAPPTPATNQTNMTNPSAARIRAIRVVLETRLDRATEVIDLITTDVPSTPLPFSIPVRGPLQAAPPPGVTYGHF